MNHTTNELTMWFGKEIRMKKKTLLDYILFIIGAILPGVVMLGIIIATSQVAQLIEVAKVADQFADDQMGLYNYMVAWVNDHALMITTIAQLTTFVIAMLVLRAKSFKRGTFGNPIKALKRFRVPGIILAGFGIELTLSSVLLIIGTLAPEALESYAEMISASGLADLSLISTIATVVVAPLCEETVFRGLTVKILEKTGWNFWVVNTLQALLFGIYHLNLVQGIYAFLLGMFLGFVAKKCNSIWGSILAHAAFNFSGTYLVTAVYGTSEITVLRLIIVVIAAVAATVAGFVLFTKLDTKEEDKTSAVLVQ